MMSDHFSQETVDDIYIKYTIYIWCLRTGDKKLKPKYIRPVYQKWVLL